jgi:hypothetical protein
MTTSPLDRLDIQDTISRYHEGGSTGDWDQVLGTFLPDGIWEVPALRILSQGQAAIRDAMLGLMAPIEYLVQINAPAIITVEGDSASARSLIRECARFRGQPDVIDVVGQFHDELRRTDDGWRFAHRTFTILGTHQSAATPAAGTA